MRALVTGGNGFVGRHLVAHLRARGDEVVVAGRTADLSDVDLPLELGDLENVCGVVEFARAAVVFHLAAQAFVPAATRDPLAAYDTNALGTARLFEAVRGAYSHDALPLVVYASSGEVYGPREPHEYPVRETLAPRPATPYAASKLAGEAMALAAWRTYGVPVVIARAFNHIGPGQDERFAAPAFARQLAHIAAGGEPTLLVGNLEAQRDFLDVRDVVAAYAAMADAAHAGEVYNVCSGRTTAMSELLRQLVTIAHVPVGIREDPARMRPSDLPVSYGDNEKLRVATGWTPTYTLMMSLRDVYADARAREQVAT
ncbi:MAG: GDP-mannose 4,6-dehydratase [Vulcanimicrobiaceae bacterium]